MTVKFLPSFAIAFLFSGLVLLMAACNSRVAAPISDDLDEQKALFYADKGSEIIGVALAELTTRLKAKIDKEGVVAAIDYCSIVALPITDSIAKVYGVEMKRTSDQLRNPKNEAIPSELEAIKNFKEDLAEGQKLSPLVRKIENGRIAFMAPIRIQELCLKCHGSKIDKAVLAILKRNYPNDKATGYALGDLRGIWSLSFDPKKTY